MSHIPPEVQKQLDEQKANCPFCKIILGEYQAKKGYEDEFMVGVLDINPWIKGHLLVMPKEHYPIIPFLPPEIFKHMFGYIGKLAGCVKKAMISTGINILVANGGVAGQQSPHFLVHILPREEGDNLDKFSLNSKKKEIDISKVSNAEKIVAYNLPIMMKNHFSKNISLWHDGNIKRALFLKDKNPIYEDEKVVVCKPENPQSIGHFVIYSQNEEKDVEKLDIESCAHLFYTASFLASIVFEGLKAQGTNIILKSGSSNDNPQGKLSIHVLARFENDELDLIGTPLSNKSDLDDIASKIKDKTFLLEHEIKNAASKKKEPINLDSNAPIQIRAKIDEKFEEIGHKKDMKNYSDHEKEIKEAIRKIWQS